MLLIRILQINCVLLITIFCLEIVTAQQDIKTKAIDSSTTIISNTGISVSDSSVASSMIDNVSAASSTDASATTQSDIGKFPTFAPTPTLTLPEDSYAVSKDDKICILIKLDAAFAVNYSRKNDALLKVNFNLPDDLQVDGSCDDKEKSQRRVSVAWQSYVMNFTIQKTGDGDRWYVASILLSYNPSEVFKNKTLEKYCQLKTSENEVFMETPVNSSFVCSDPRKIAFYNDRDMLSAHMVTQAIQLQAYGIPKDGSFGPEFPCGPKLEIDISPPTASQEERFRSDTVPIAVGSCLAVITVLVIAGYAAYRSLTVKKLDYATMEE